MLDLESEVWVSILTVGNILLLDFFVSRRKAFDASICVIANVVYYGKTRLERNSN